MPTIGDIDLTKKPMMPQLFLATPNGTVIAKLKDSYNIIRKTKLGSIDELSFSVPYDVERKHDIVRNPIIDKIKDRYLIKHVLGNEIQWYQITKITDDMDDNGDTKNIVAMLLPYELRDKLIRKYKAESKNCTTILNEILVGSNPLEPLTLWRVGYVDGDFDVKFRSFDVSSKTTLDFLLEVAETYGAIIVWDTVNRIVDFRKPDLIGANRGLKMSYGKYVKTLSKDSITDEMTTRLKVFGKDDMSIQRINPTGSNYLESFSYFLYPFQQDPQGNVLAHSDYMSDDLCKAIVEYDAKIDDVKGDFENLSTNRANAVTRKTGYEIELVDLENALAQIQDRVDIQHANQTIVSQVNDYPGTAKTYTFAMNEKGSGKKFAIMAKVVDTSGITLKYGGLPLPESITSNTWALIAKKNVAANQVLNDSISVEGATTTKVHLLVVEISTFEYSGVIVDGNKITSNGTSSKSTITSNEVGVDWSTVEVGYNVYIKRSSSEEWRYDSSQLVGIVDSAPQKIVDADGDTIGWSVTLDRALASGDYSFGYAFVGNNDAMIIDKYSIDNKQMQIDAKNLEITVVNNEITGIDAQISALRNEIKIENFFTTQELRNERNQFIIEKEWSDSNYINDSDLYEAAVKKFEQIRSPQTVIQLDIVNFLEIIEAQRDWDKLVLGDTITIVYEKIGVNVQAKVIEIEYSHENGEIKLTIANVKDLETDEEKLIKMLYKSVSTSATVDMKKFDWDGAANDISEINGIIRGQWDAAKRAIVAGVNESVTIDARGLTISDPNDPLTFLRATHGVLGITNDGGNSFKHAITGAGIVAERLYGQIITGQALTLGDSDGIFRIIGNKATISDRSGTEVMKLGLYDTDATSGVDKFGLVLLHTNHRVLMDKDDGFKIEKKLIDGSYENIAWLDTQGRLNLNDIIATGAIEATTIRADVKLTVGNIDVGNLITDLDGGLQKFQNWIKNEMIEIGSISADKIKTNELIVGTNITMGANATISWNAVTGKPSLASPSDINWDNVKSTVITAGGITTPYLASTAIDGMVITGATVRTAASGNRVEMDNVNGLRLISAGGSTVVHLKLDGSAVFKGEISSGSTISGSTLESSKVIFNEGSGYSGVSWRVSGVEKAYMDREVGPGGGLTLSNDRSINITSGNIVNLTGTNGVYAGSRRIDVAPVAVFG